MKSIEELKEIRDRMKNTINLRDDNNKNIRVLVGMATCGISAGARTVINAIIEEVAKCNLANVMVCQTGCVGMCRYEPIVEVYQGDDKTTYVDMTPEKAVKMVHEHLVNNRVVTEYTISAEK